MPVAVRPHLRAWSSTLLPAAAALVLLTGCTSGASGGSDEAAAGEDAITVEHAMGETTIPAPPKRIVALDTSYVDAAIALEAEVVGRTDYSDGGGLRDYLGEEGERYAGDAEVVGSLEQPDLAKIAELDPDLILSAKVRHEDVYDQLSKIAPTVFSETTGSSWKENIELAGAALGKEDLAAEKIGAYEKRADDLGAAIKKANGGKAPTMTLARFAGEPTVRLYSSASFPGIVQQDVGLPRPEDAPDNEGDIMVALSEEEILDLDADHIFTAVWQDGTGDSEEKAGDFRANPLWDQLKGDIHEVDDGAWVSSVSLQGADAILDDLAKTFDVRA